MFVGSYFAQVDETDAGFFNIPRDLNTVSRRLAKKLTSLGITREEYVLMKAMILLNPGTSVRT